MHSPSAAVPVRPGPQSPPRSGSHPLSRPTANSSALRRPAAHSTSPATPRRLAISPPNMRSRRAKSCSPSQTKLPPPASPTPSRRRHRQHLRAQAPLRPRRYTRRGLARMLVAEAITRAMQHVSAASSSNRRGKHARQRSTSQPALASPSTASTRHVASDARYDEQPRPARPAPRQLTAAH